MDIKQMIDIKKFNWLTIASLFFLFAGILFYLYWGITYGVWADIGIYSITVTFLLFGILLFILSVYKKK